MSDWEPVRRVIGFEVLPNRDGRDLLDEVALMAPIVRRPFINSENPDLRGLVYAIGSDKVIMDLCPAILGHPGLKKVRYEEVELGKR